MGLPVLLITGATAPKLGAGLNAGALLPKLGAGVLAAGAPKLGVDVADGNVAPALSFNFSCVRPYAAIPSMAPMAMWNKPAPCSVIGLH